MSSLTNAEIGVLLADAAERARSYLAHLDERPVAPDEAALAGLAMPTITGSSPPSITESPQL